MKVLTIMGCGVIAAACSMGKQTDRTVDYPQSDPSTTATTTRNDPERTVAPDYDDSAAPADSERAGEARRPDRKPLARGDARAASQHLSTVGEESSASKPAGPQPPPVAAPVPRTEPDNTRINERDRGGDTLTPMDQGSSDVDMMLTQRIRKAVMGDSTLSFSAKNVKVISKDGKVTLRGAVKNERERKSIGEMATKVAGAGNVDNQLEVSN